MSLRAFSVTVMLLRDMASPASSGLRLRAG